jgi:hypothetical protein
MAICFYRAVITAENYEAFRRVLKDAPKTFDEWNHLRTKDLAYIEGGGGTVVYVDINPDEFAADCRATGAPNDMKSLDNLAFKKAPWK